MNSLQELFSGVPATTLFVSGNGSPLFTLTFRSNARSFWYCGGESCQFFTVAPVSLAPLLVWGGRALALCGFVIRIPRR